MKEYITDLFKSYDIQLDNIKEAEGRIGFVVARKHSYNLERLWRNEPANIVMNGFELVFSEDAMNNCFKFTCLDLKK